MKKQLPILFSTPMVQAIIDGRKTQTRRIVNTKHKGWDAQEHELSFTRTLTREVVENGIAKASQVNELVGFHAFFKEQDSHLGIKCPYGQPGDLLWVRETHDPTGCGGSILYKADYTLLELSQAAKGVFRWKPSIHMKKDYARIWLQVEEIGVERLQDISEEDAKAEGILPLAASSAQLATHGQLYFDYSKPKQLFNEGLPPFWSFNSLWCSINGGDSWEENPWLWVVKYKVLSTTGKPENITP